MTDDDTDNDESDDEELWEGMCELTARYTELSVNRVKVIMERAGMHAYGHTGIMDMIEEAACYCDERIQAKVRAMRRECV